MTSETTVSLEERIRQLLRHLAIDHAHFACRLAQDWTGLAAKYPEMVSSLTVVGGSFDPRVVRVTKPGGRVALVARAIDMPFLRNLVLSAGLKAKAEAPGGGIAAHGCADASLYRRMHHAGLTQVKMLPQLAVFDRSEPTILEFMLDGLLQKLSPEEATEWQTALAEAEGGGHLLHDLAASLCGGDKGALSASHLYIAAIFGE